MITENMTLNTATDAAQWASDMGMETTEQEKNVAAYIWENKPSAGCTYAEFIAANPDFTNEEFFWDIADGK